MKNRTRRNQRKDAPKSSGLRCLIVTEGEKTEPNYFKGMRKAKRLHGVQVTALQSPLGTDPLSVLKGAVQLFLEGNTHKGILRLNYDYVFVVFDRDQHENYAPALQQVSNYQQYKNDEGKKVPFVAIPSNPCFEYWLLLHYENCMALKDRREVCKSLLKYYKNYEKKHEEIFEDTQDKLEIALNYADRINRDSHAMCCDKPFTDMPKIIRILLPEYAR